MTSHHIKRSSGHITSISCKGCGVVIQSLAPHPGADPAIRKVGNTIIRDSFVHVAPNNNYKEFGIVLSDGDDKRYCHVTHSCKKCFSSFTALNPKALADKLKSWHIQDLDDLRIFTLGPKMPKKHYDTLSSLSVVGIDETMGVDLQELTGSAL